MVDLIKKILLKYSIKGIRKYDSDHRFESIINQDFMAYKTLVYLGDYSLPYLKTLIGKDDEPRWYFVSACREILKKNDSNFKSPEPILKLSEDSRRYIADPIASLENQEKYLKDYLNEFLK
jgi:hypothetical protein